MSPQATLILEPPAPAAPTPSAAEALDTLESLLSVLPAPGDDAARERIDLASAAAARAITTLPRNQLTPTVIERALTVGVTLGAVRAGSSRPLWDAGESDSSSRGTGAVVARLLLGLAWQSSSTPLLGEVPESLWGSYAAWLFASPVRSLDAEETEHLARHLLRQTEELARWIERNRGSASVRAAVDAYMARASLLPLNSATTNFRRLAEARARILGRNWGRPATPHAPPVLPRVGRRLRVAAVCRDLEVSADSLSWLGRVEQLDPAGFEVSVFTFRDADSPLARRCRQRVTEVRVLPTEPESQVEVLREAAADVLLFAGSLTGAADGFCRLALHRAAPLQVLLEPAGVTSGFPEIDLLIGDGAAAPERYSERLGRLAGSTQVFALSVPASDDQPIFEREALGWPATAVVFVAVIDRAGYDVNSPATWARILATAPQARLVVYFVSASVAGANVALAFNAALHAALAQEGIAADRVNVFAPEAPSHAEGRALLRLAQGYLAPLRAGEPVWIAEAMAAGVPTIYCADSGAHAGVAAMLRAADAAELIATDTDEYVRYAADLAADESFRTGIANRIKAAAEQGLDFADTLSASDAFGHLLETAFDELEALGRKAFRAGKGVLAVSAGGTDAALAAAAASLEQGDSATAAYQVNLALRQAPGDPEARWLQARVLLSEGQLARAIEYLLAVVQRRPGDADVWLTLATALRGNGQNAEAVQALESGLRLDRARADGWLMMIELAEEGGATELAREALLALREVAPEHPRIGELAQRLEA